MKWRLSTFLLLGITIILCLGYLRQKHEISRLSTQPKVIGKTDTIYKQKPFKYEPAFNTVQLPNYVFLYSSEGNPHHEVEVVNTSTPSQGLAQDNFGVSKEDSLVQVILNRERLSLSFKNTNTDKVSYSTLDYKINLDEFKYNWSNGQLTRERLGFKLKLKPYVYANYRYFNRMADLGLGISFETRNLHYKLGLNGFYYPCLQNKLGTDLEFSITYNLSK